MLITVQEVKDYLSISSNTGATSNANISTLANYAIAAVETYCGRVFANTALTEVHDGGKSSIFLDNPPINIITTVEEYDGQQYVPLVGPLTSQELPNLVANANATPGFYWDKDTGQLSRDTGSTSGNPDIGTSNRVVFRNFKRGVKVTYSGGYNTIPNDIKMATLDYVKLIYKKEQGTSSFSLSGENKSAIKLSSSKFPPHIERILQLYRLI